MQLKNRLPDPVYISTVAMNPFVKIFAAVFFILLPGLMSAQNLEFITTIDLKSTLGGTYKAPERELAGTFYDNGTLVYTGIGGMNAENHPRYIGNRSDWGKMLFVDVRSGNTWKMQVPMQEVCDELPSVISGLKRYGIYPSMGISGGPLTLIIGEGTVEEIKKFHIFAITD